MGHVTTSEFFQLEDKTLTDDRSSQPWFRPRQGGNHDSACERFCNYHKCSLQIDKILKNQFSSLNCHFQGKVTKMIT